MAPDDEFVNLNLHVLTREALEQVRVAFPDPLIDVEHRGEGDCEVNASAVIATIAALLGVALASLAHGESLWIRSSGTDSTALTVDLRWRGREPDAALLAGAERSAASTGGAVVREPLADEHHLGFRLPRLA